MQFCKACPCVFITQGRAFLFCKNSGPRAKSTQILKEAGHDEQDPPHERRFLPAMAWLNHFAALRQLPNNHRGLRGKRPATRLPNKQGVYPMKNNNVKRHKLVALLLAGALCVAALTGCGASAAAAPSASAAPAVSSKAGDTYKVGLIQLVTHTSLDEIRTAIVAELKTEAAAQGATLSVDYKNAENDQAAIDTICRGFVADKVDVIIAIATPAAQGAAAAVQGTDIPVIFSAVTDPVAAGLVTTPDAPDYNITGTSDAIAVGDIFDLAAKLTPQVKNYGLFYCLNEVNSQTVIEEAKQYLDGKGISYEVSGVSSVSDVQSAITALAGKVDGIFIPIDNTVASAMSTVAAICTKAGVPVYVSADSMVKDGGLATVGVNYTQLGTQTADMAMKVLTGTDPKDLPVETMKDYAVTVNPDTAAALGVDVSAYTAK